MLAVMEESRNKKHVEGGDREILYSKAIKAGKRIYYLDVKRNLKDDLFVAVTESKKIQSKDGLQISFEKHKIFLCGKLLTHNGLFLSMSKTARYLFLFVLH